jgi:hypothetical protein
MNKCELAFFYELRKQLPDSYHICTNMRIADMMDATAGVGFYKRRNAILPKHVDFLICDAYFRPVVAIEVNGYSHRRPDRVERDKQVKTIFSHAELPLVFVDVGTNFAKSIAEIKSNSTVA